MRVNLLLAASAGLLSACASGMSKDACAGADWFALGEADGLAGEPSERLAKRAEACAEHGFPADVELYRAGRSVGLSRYCTPEGGFEAGRAGLAYRGVCSPEDEARFLPEFELGAEMFRVTTAYDAAVANYESAIEALDQHRYNLRISRRRFENPNLSTEDREKARQDMEHHRREIERIERDLPLLEVEIDRARDALDDFRAYMARLGR